MVRHIKKAATVSANPAAFRGQSAKCRLLFPTATATANCCSYYFSIDFFSASRMPLRISSSTEFLALLNSRIPRPRPRISSGILLPPNNNRTTIKMRRNSVAPRFCRNNKVETIFSEFKMIGQIRSMGAVFHIMSGLTGNVAQSYTPAPSIG